MDSESVVISPENEEVSPESNNGSGETESHTEVDYSSDLLEQVSLTNSLLTGIILFLGIICGVICMKLFYERFHK